MQSAATVVTNLLHRCFKVIYTKQQNAILQPGYINLNLCPTQLSYWAKNHVAVLTRAAYLMTY